jgi:arginyl-tRNA synthetase
MKSDVEQLIAEVVRELYGQDVPVELTRPEEQFGDFATNIALQLAKTVGKNPREIADELAASLRAKNHDSIASVSVAGPGFLNLTLSQSGLRQALHQSPAHSLEGQVIVTEYSDPNPFKVLHAGHLYTSVVGDAIANVLEQAGATVHRVNFGGDVGMHVAKTMWAIIKEVGGETPEKLNDIPEAERSEWMAKNYVAGTQAFEDDETAKAEITVFNKRVYALHTENDHDSQFAQIYWTCRQWSYDYFDSFYARIGSHFEKYYPESMTMTVGLETVREHVFDGVYQESDGAIIFDGEKYGLHTRVFINSEGLPTYEAKDVGLSFLKAREYHFDRSIIITANEQEQYMQVVLKSIEQFAPELSQATTHLTHGIVKLAGGVKMSSRKGNFLRAVDVLDAASEASKTIGQEPNEAVVLGAVKYAFIKNRMGGDIIYDPKESVSIEGNSGPYLQYAHARARSILRKADMSDTALADFDDGERSLARKLSEYADVIDRATTELSPHIICTYLYELAQTFNRFYEHNRVIDDPRQATRLALVTMYANRLKSGLELLGIIAPDSM